MRTKHILTRILGNRKDKWNKAKKCHFGRTGAVLGRFCDRMVCGSVAEWLKAHDSKSCGQQCLGGSNPLASAMNFVHVTDRWSVFSSKSVSSNFASQKALPP